MNCLLNDQSEYLDLLASHYRKFSGGPKPTGLKSSLVDNSAFIGCVQWHLTPEETIDFDLLCVENLNTKTWGVLVNIEIVHYLLSRGIDSKNIFFYSDCLWRSTWAKKILDPSNIFIMPTSNKKEFKRYIKMAEKTVDFVLNNVPFGMFKEFKSLAQNLAREKALIISGSRDYHNNEKAFENVEYYKYLGECFPTAKIVASVVIVNPIGANSFSVGDANGTITLVQRNHAVPPGDNVSDYVWALSVLDLKLTGYTKFQTGRIYRKDANFDPAGVKVAFTMGRAGADFDSDNFGNNYDEIQLQKTAWSRVDKSQQALLGGFGIHAIGVSYMANKNGHLGNVKYLPPDMGCGEKSYWHPVSDEADANAAIKYLNHPDVVRLVSVLKSSVCSNGKETFSLIPHHTHAKTWIKNYV